MIAAMREWLTSIVVVAMALSVMQLLIPEGSIRKIASFAGGLLLMISLLRPLLGSELERLELDLTGYRNAIQERQEELAADSDKELRQLIETRTAAYISQQAEEMGLQVEAKIKTEPGEGGVPVPVEVEITGGHSAALEDWIAGELGIPRERQVWHEEN